MQDSYIRQYCIMYTRYCRILPSPELLARSDRPVQVGVGAVGRPPLVLKSHFPPTVQALTSYISSVYETRGQSNLTKSASRGPIPRLGVTPGGRKLYH